MAAINRNGWPRIVGLTGLHISGMGGRFHRNTQWEQQRVELAHELGHVLLHCGRQEFMPDEWRAAQELQADKFALYALAPTCMLANYLTSATTRYELAHQLAYQFDVPEPFMDVRLQLLEQRLQDITVRQELSRVVAEHRATYDYSYRHPTNPRIEYLVKNNRVVGKRQRADI